MITNVKILTHLVKPNYCKSEEKPIYLRITIDGLRTEISTGKYCKPELWDKRAKRMKGKTEDVRTLNTYLDTLEQKVFEAQLILTKSNAKITPSCLKKILLGKKSNPIKLIEIFKKHNREIKSLIGKGYAKATYIRYETSLRHTQNFLKWKYETTDMEIQYINHEFITSYEFYLRSECNCQNNSAVKYIKNFKKIIRICLANGWLVNDPFSKYKSRVKVTERVFLNADELEAIRVKKIANERLSQVRDIFLFSCFTGLSYIDVNKLRTDNIVKGPDGEMWINTKRQKTSIATNVPLLPSALKLIHNYKDHPVCSNTGKVFPVSSNQKMNAYLKEIADICGINKELTYHIARHTFATTVTLSNGVPIESVSKMLGHTNIKTTQHYAKILDLKVGEDMAELRKKYAR